MNIPKLTNVLRLDSIKLDETYFTEEGYLIDHPIVTTCGIFEYTNPDGTTRRELRLPENVFFEKSLSSYEGKPVIVTHDAGVVTKDNVEDEIIGTILSKGYQDGDNVRAKIVIHDTDTLKNCGLRELSLGYNLTLDETPGTWNNEPYDAVQQNIEINHLALVGNARAGETARLNIDEKNNNLPSKLQGGKHDMSMKKGKRKDSEETPAADQEITTLPTSEEGENTNLTTQGKIQMVKDRRDRRDQEGEPETTDIAKGTIIQQDADIKTLLEVIDELMAKSDFDSTSQEDSETDNNDEGENEAEADNKSSSLNTDSVSKIVQKEVQLRLELGRIGDKLNLDGIENMSIINAKKSIIKSVNPNLRLDGKSDAYINAAFDLAKDTLSTRKDSNYQRSQMFNLDGKFQKPAIPQSSAEKARADMIERQKNGGKKA